MILVSSLTLGAFTYAAYAVPVEYDVSVELEGSLPVMAGDDKKAEVEMSFKVICTLGEASLRTTFELSQFSVGLFDSSLNVYQPLPVGKSQAQEFFPKTTVLHSASGKFVGVEPKAKPSPFALPGVDTDTLPGLTFLALEFGDEVGGKEWSYERSLLGTKYTYTAKHLGKDDRLEKFALTVSNEGSGQWVKGHGTVWFDPSVGRIAKGDLSALVETRKGTESKTTKMKVALTTKVEK